MVSDCVVRERSRSSQRARRTSSESCAEVIVASGAQVAEGQIEGGVREGVRERGGEREEERGGYIWLGTLLLGMNHFNKRHLLDSQKEFRKCQTARR